VRRLLIGMGRSWALVGFLAVAACGEGAELDRLAAGERGRVAEVTSGETVVLKSGLVVRLAGVETPRWGEPGAREALDDLRRLALGKDIELYYGGARRDAYGRVLAQARLAGSRRWLECALLSDGVVLVRTYADNRALARPMLACEARARRGRRGLWADSKLVRLPAEVDDRDTHFQIIEGRIARASVTQSGIYLDLDGAAPGFALQIIRRATPDFDRAGLSPQSLVGKLVRVRGVISTGLMRLDHPEQLEVLSGG
jgi:micrococcal nuclease